MKRIVVFLDHSFPFQGSLPREPQLPEGTIVCDAHSLAAELGNHDTECLVTLHGPYFPKHAWPAILSFLQKGGGLVHVGGAPFKIPVEAHGGNWIIKGEMTAYHQQLQIHEALPVKTESVARLSANSDLPIFRGAEHLLTIQPTYGLILHVTKHADYPGQGGSGGPMDAHIYPLVKGISVDGREIAAPVVAIENTKGAFSGGRWVLVNQAVHDGFWTNQGVGTILSCADWCAKGVTEMWLKPGYAAYPRGESDTVVATPANWPKRVRCRR